MNATEVTAGLAESNGSLLPGLRRDSLHVTCGLTACTPGSAPGPTLGNEYGKTVPVLTRGRELGAQWTLPTPLTPLLRHSRACACVSRGIHGSVTKGRLRGGGGGGRRRRRRCGGGAKSPPSFHLIQLSSPQRVHNALQIV